MPANTFTPRFSADGIYGSKYYYNENPFHITGYGMPNCTCYAWGRFYEITGVKPSLPLGDAGTWLDDVNEAHTYETGATPMLGAVGVWGSLTGGSGHVAVVEYINNDGSFIISQSGYYRPIATYPPDTEDYFWLDSCDVDTKKAGWMGDYYFQGFIYNPVQPSPDQPHTKRRKTPLWMLLRYGI